MDKCPPHRRRIPLRPPSDGSSPDHARSPVSSAWAVGLRGASCHTTRPKRALYELIHTRGRGWIGTIQGWTPSPASSKPMRPDSVTPSPPVSVGTWAGKPPPRPWRMAGRTGSECRRWTTPSVTSTASAATRGAECDPRRPIAFPLPATVGEPWIEPGLPGALAALPERQRVVVWMLHSLDLSMSQVASTLGITKGTVQRHAERGMASLRSRMGVPT
jgi:hypothetical protein